MKTRLILNRWDEHGRSIHVEAEWGSFRKVFARVMQDVSLRDYKPGAVVVSWSGIGSVDSDAALAAAACIERAAHVGREIEQIKEWERITPPMENGRWEGEGMPEITIADGKASVSDEGWVVEAAG